MKVIYMCAVLHKSGPNYSYPKPHIKGLRRSLLSSLFVKHPEKSSGNASVNLKVILAYGSAPKGTAGERQSSLHRIQVFRPLGRRQLQARKYILIKTTQVPEGAWDLFKAHHVCSYVCQCVSKLDGGHVLPTLIFLLEQYGSNIKPAHKHANVSCTLWLRHMKCCPQAVFGYKFVRTTCLELNRTSNYLFVIGCMDVHYRLNNVNDMLQSPIDISNSH